MSEKTRRDEARVQKARASSRPVAPDFRGRGWLPRFQRFRVRVRLCCSSSSSFLWCFRDLVSYAQCELAGRSRGGLRAKRAEEDRRASSTAPRASSCVNISYKDCRGVSASISAPSAVEAGSEPYLNPRVFCTFYLRRNILDARVRKPPGADAGGDVVSAEPLLKATTFELVEWSENGDPFVVSGSAPP